MEVKDGRAAAQRKIAENNLNRVAKWFESNPDGSRKECAKRLKLGYWTVCRIINELKNKQGGI